MPSLRKSPEPILILHELYALAAGGGTAGAAVELPNLPVSVRIAAPVVVAALVKAAGWLNRQYVSPAYEGLHRKALAAGLDLPSESVLIADALKVIDATLGPVPAAEPSPASTSPALPVPAVSAPVVAPIDANVTYAAGFAPA